MLIMKLQDLRIGNIFDYHGQQVEVMAINESYAEFGYFKDRIAFSRAFISDFPNPIKLTEEILIKFGFEEVDSDWYDFNNIGVNFRLKRMLYITIDKHDNEIYHELPFKDFLHDFQNLIYCITGEELKFK